MPKTSHGRSRTGPDTITVRNSHSHLLGTLAVTQEDMDEMTVQQPNRRAATAAASTRSRSRSGIPVRHRSGKSTDSDLGRGPLNQRGAPMGALGGRGGIDSSGYRQHGSPQRRSSGSSPSKQQHRLSATSLHGAAKGVKRRARGIGQSQSAA